MKQTETTAFNSPQALFRALAGIALLGLGFWILHRFVVAFAWATVLAIATWPLYRRLDHQAPARLNRSWLALLFTVVVGAVFFLPLLYAGVHIALEAQNLPHFVTHFKENGLPAPPWVESIPWIGAWLLAKWNLFLATPQAATQLINHVDVGAAFEWAKRISLELLHRTAVMAFTLLILFFVYRYADTIGEKLLVLATRLFGEPAGRYSMHAASTVRATLNGLVLVALGEGVFLAGGYAVADLSHPILLGALTALVAIIPLLGPAVLTVICVGIFASGSPAIAVALLVYGGIVLFVADHFVRPALIGGTAHLPFLWVLLGILGGLENFGLLGLFLGPAILAVLISLWRDVTAEKGADLPPGP
ncbi:MAG TPA: AI-2E family transporter [Acidiferrobacterales bacterium]|nr:AI-2E family transporter [Acidiferrobacterales bacterium]